MCRPLVNSCHYLDAFLSFMVFVADCIFKRWLSQCLPTPCSSYKVILPCSHWGVGLVLSPWISASLYLKWSNTTSFTRIGHKKWRSLQLVLLRCLHLEPGHHAVRKPKAAHGKTLQRCSGEHPSWGPDWWQHQAPDSEWMSLQMISAPQPTSPQSLSHPSWALKYQEAETSHPLCALSEFLTHRSHTNNKMVVVLCQNFGVGYYPARVAGAMFPFTWKVLSLLCPWALLFFPQQVIRTLAALWVSHLGNFVHIPWLWHFSSCLFTSSVLRAAL